MLTVNLDNSPSVQNQKIFTSLDSSWSAFVHEIKYNVNYSIDELCQFVSDGKNYDISSSRFSTVIHKHLSSNQYVAQESNEVLQNFTSLVFSAQCSVADLISKRCHEHTIFYRFFSGFGLPLIHIIQRFNLSEEVLTDLLIITANRAFKNNLENNENNNLWHQVIPSTSLSYSSVEQISKCPAIDFSREVSWMGGLELFHSNQDIVRLGVRLSKLPYFMRLDSLISLYRGLGGLNLVCSVLDVQRNTDKIYINYAEFRKTVAMFCLKQKIISSNPYSFVQGITDSCEDVEMTDEGYQVIHEDNLYVFKRADLFLKVSHKVGGDRFIAFIDYIESMLPSHEDKESHYINLDRLNEMFEMMPILN